MIMITVLRIINYCSCWQHAALRASQFGPLRLWLWQLCFRVSSLRWLTTSSLDHLHLLHFLDPFFEEANNIISWSSFPSTLSSLLSYTFWGRQHPLFSILTFFYLSWRRLATSSLILFDVFLFFEAVNILPWSSWMFVSLLEEAGNILLSFSISCHVCWGQQNAILIHFLLSLTFLADNIPPSHFLFLFRGGQQHHVLSFCFLKLIEADTIPFWSSWFS